MMLRTPVNLSVCLYEQQQDLLRCHQEVLSPGWPWMDSEFLETGT